MEAAAGVQLPEELDGHTVARLAAAIDAALAGPGQVVTVEGSATVFCRGLSLATLRNPAVFADALPRFASALERLQNASKPLVGVLRGEAMGGGLGILAACDHVIAQENARCGLPEMLFGLLPALVRPLLLRRISPQAFRSLAMNAGTITAQQARSIGLVDEVVSAHERPRAVAAACRRLSRLSPGAVAELRALEQRPANPALDLAALSRLAASADSRTRIQRFLDGHSPWDTETVQ
jgi:enoyl-CoA hydratase/carnithine racemase